MQRTTAARSLALVGECPLASSLLRQRLPSPATTSPPPPLLKTPKFPHLSTPFPLLPRSHPWPPPAPGSGAEPAIAGSLPGLLPAVALPARFYWARRGIPSHLGAFTGGRWLICTGGCSAPRDLLLSLREDRPLVAVAKRALLRPGDSRAPVSVLPRGGRACRNGRLIGEI